MLEKIKIPDEYTSVYKNIKTGELLFTVVDEEKNYYFHCSDGKTRNRAQLTKEYIFLESKYMKTRQKYPVKCLMCGKTWEHTSDVKFLRCTACELKAKDIAYNVVY